MQGLLTVLSLVAAVAHAAPAAPPLSQYATKSYTLSGDLYAPTPGAILGNDPSEALPTTSTDPTHFDTAPGQDTDTPSGASYDLTNLNNPQPFRGTRGGTAAFNRDEDLEKLFPNSLIPPTTDHGSVDQASWPMGMSHVKLGKQRAGWSRQQNIGNLPAATEMAGVNMRLEAGAYRELHWHKAGEWALMLNGSARIQAMDTDGRSFIDDVGPGDVWFFPSGIPHSIQALHDGTEFMLVFDDGSFSEDNTFLISETFAYNPKEALAKNFQTDTSAFDNIPAGELFIFPGTEAPSDIEAQNVTGPAGAISPVNSYSFHWSQQEPIVTPGGTVKIIDSSVFPIAKNFAAALVTIHPGAMREIHWHPTSDEWGFFLAGKARATIYAATANSRSFDYHVGDVSYIEHAMSHYIENTGDEDVVLLEVLQAERFTDISLGQWMALTAPQIIQDTLNVSNTFLENLSKEKPLVVQGPTTVHAPTNSTSR